ELQRMERQVPQEPIVLRTNRRTKMIADLWQDMRFGAQSGNVLRLVIGQGMKLAFVGVATGLVASLALTRTMKNLLFGVSATDAGTSTMIVVLLIAVALRGCWLSACRATKVDPMVALRVE